MPAHPANAPFTVEVADSHPQVEVSRRRSRSYAVLETTILFRSSRNSTTRVQAEGAEKIRVAVTGSEATAYGIPTFTERTSVTLTHRDVNFALRSSLEQYKQSRPRQAVRFVTVSPIPDHEVLPSPTTPAVTLPSLSTQRARKSRFPRKDDRLEAAEHLLLPPVPLAGLKEAEEEITAALTGKPSLEAWAEKVAEECKKAQASHKPAPLSINTNIPSAAALSSPSSTTSSKMSFPERPTAPEPASPSDSDDDDGGAVFKRPGAPEPGAMSSVASLGCFSGRSAVEEGSSRVSPSTKTIKSKLTSSKSRLTASLATDGFGYVDGIPLARSRKSSVSSTSSTKRRVPVVKKLFGIGKRKAASADVDDRKPKGQKRQRGAGGEEDDENVAVEQEKETRIIAGRNIRRKLLA
ncbi:hypothetical protein Moror_12752 [Moniliophthora roreri MCA 2997]|uniref:Uncharacterized protein n=2 Tax=Moniliophthora roreri TaxID=221103 RepID=V2XSC4_MONRO|nr:hypothetical protein Moror_12752 [Moniliophthora roreri MCA 2997]KAI3617981.1 hypothetical protein WG66_005501 [Moniliophthora roreri]